MRLSSGVAQKSRQFWHGRLERFAQAKHELLVVLQGPDTSGKDGTVRRVFSPLNPLGVVATSFKKPTPHELPHDFLWRIHKAVPPAGMFGIFNRSHYEDVLVPRVHGLVSAERIEARYGQINAFEQHLVEMAVIRLVDLRFDYERGFINIEPAPARAAKAQ